MKRRVTLLSASAFGAILDSILAVMSVAQDSKPATKGPASIPTAGNGVALPKPVTEGGKTLMDALKNRKSTREYAAKKLPEQILSNLLWAACGVNRPDTGKRTAPSAMDYQEVDVYVATADGVWLFDAKAHALIPVLTEDIRALTGTQEFVKDAPVNLIYVADYSRMGKTPEAEKKWVACADAGFISQNVYLFCSAEGLATVVRGLVNRPPLAKAMKLRADQAILLAQSLGYPKN